MLSNLLLYENENIYPRLKRRKFDLFNLFSYDLPESHFVSYMFNVYSPWILLGFSQVKWSFYQFDN